MDPLGPSTSQDVFDPHGGQDGERQDQGRQRAPARQGQSQTKFPDHVRHGGLGRLGGGPRSYRWIFRMATPTYLPCASSVPFPVRTCCNGTRTRRGTTPCVRTYGPWKRSYTVHVRRKPSPRPTPTPGPGQYTRPWRKNWRLPNKLQRRFNKRNVVVIPPAWVLACTRRTSTVPRYYYYYCQTRRTTMPMETRRPMRGRRPSVRRHNSWLSPRRLGSHTY